VKNPSDMTDCELSQAVHREVFGLEPIILPVKIRPLSDTKAEWHEYPNYSTSISDAWQVVERMRELGWWWSGYGNSLATTVKDVCFTFQSDEDTDRQTKFKVYAQSLPRAICEAALAAVRNSKKEQA